MADIVNAEKLETIAKETAAEMGKFTKDFLSAYKSILVEDALSGEGNEGGEMMAEGGEMMAEGGEMMAEAGKMMAEAGEMMAEAGEMMAEGGEMMKAEGAEMMAEGGEMMAEGGEMMAEGGEMKAEGDMMMKSEGGDMMMKKSGRELLSRNTGGEMGDEPLKTGLLTKRGDVRKNWKERFFVVRPNYMIEYYENEAKFKAGAKPKGTINLAGYDVVTDPNARKVEEKKYNQATYGVEFSGEYTKYEPFTIECYHALKRRWLVKCPCADTFKSWSAMFKLCAKNVNSGTLECPKMQQAFNDAANAMAKRMKVKDVPQGTETEVISQMLAPCVWKTHIGDAAFAAVPGPAGIKLKAREKGFQAVYKTISGSVTVAWKGLLAATTAISGKAKELIAKGIGPIRSARESTTEKVSGAVNDTVDPVKSNVLVPVAKKVVSILGKFSVGPILSVDESLDIAATRYAEQRSTGGECSLKGIKNNNNTDMAPTATAFYDFNDAVNGDNLSDIVDSIVSSVDAIGDAKDTFLGFFKIDQYVSSLQDSVLNNAEDAGYTFEKLLEDSMGGDTSKALENKDQVLQTVKEKYRHDARMDQVSVTTDFLTDLLNSLLVDKVGEVLESICEPFDSLIPEPLQDLISISGLLGDVISSVVDSVVEQAVEEGLKEFELN